MNRLVTAVDLFAGFGGFTEGATQAGVEVRYAANHWPTAVQVHSLNHPSARHECQDLRQADWTKLPSYDLLLASPACQGHSTAAQPKRVAKHDADRATAWAVVDCADATNPHALIVENVPSFRRWRLYQNWTNCLTALGYQLQEHVVMATDFGVPQLRERLFIVGTRYGEQLQLPKAKELPAFGPCIDWNAGGWRPVSETTDTARARFAKGRANHGRTFLSQHVTDHPGVGLHEPIRTITCAAQHWLLVDGEHYRYLTPRELARGMGFPESYHWPEQLDVRTVTKGLGNAVPPPMARGLIEATVAAAFPAAQLLAA